LWLDPPLAVYCTAIHAKSISSCADLEKSFSLKFPPPASCHKFGNFPLSRCFSLISSCLWTLTPFRVSKSYGPGLLLVGHATVHYAPSNLIASSPCFSTLEFFTILDLVRCVNITLRRLVFNSWDPPHWKLREEDRVPSLSLLKFFVWSRACFPHPFERQFLLG